MQTDPNVLVAIITASGVIAGAIITGLFKIIPIVVDRRVRELEMSLRGEIESLKRDVADQAEIMSIITSAFSDAVDVIRYAIQETLEQTPKVALEIRKRLRGITNQVMAIEELSHLHDAHHDHSKDEDSNAKH